MKQLNILLFYKTPLYFKILYFLAACVGNILSFFFIIGFIVAGMPFIPVSPTDFVIGTIAVFGLTIILMFFAFTIMNGYKVRLGANDQGLYVNFFMSISSKWIPWKNVINLQIRPYYRFGISKKRCIFLEVKKGSKIKKVPVLFEKEVSEEYFKKLTKVIQSYIDKSKEG